MRTGIHPVLIKETLIGQKSIKVGLLELKLRMCLSSSPFMLDRLSRRCAGDHVHQHLVGGRAKAAEDYSIELVTEILRGVRDTADAEEKWGDECSEELIASMRTAGVMHDVHDVSVAAAYRAEDLDAATEKLTVKLKYADGRVESTE